MVWENAELNISKEEITIESITKINDKLVMHIAETELMKKFAEVVTKNGGDILEIGFGMGLSASEIQTYNIKSHTIIERHPQINQTLI